jgi:hypothetical protein
MIGVFPAPAQVENHPTRGEIQEFHTGHPPDLVYDFLHPGRRAIPMMIRCEFTVQLPGLKSLAVVTSS